MMGGKTWLSTINYKNCCKNFVDDDQNNLLRREESLPGKKNLEILMPVASQV